MLTRPTDPGRVPAASGRLVGRIRRRFERSPALAKVAGNVGWLVSERVAVLVAGFAVNVWLVRHLGPARYGLYGYALNFATVFGFVASLGLDPIIVREVARAPQEDGRILGTALVLRTAAASVAWVGCVVAVFVARSDTLTRAMVAVIAVGAVALAAGVFELWFQARIAARDLVVARTAIFLSGCAARCALIFFDLPLAAFAVLLMLTSVATVAASYLLYRTHRAAGARLSWDAGRARSLAADAWPLMIASASVIVYMKIDQVMLASMAGDAENGIYAVAAALSEVWYFLPGAIAATVFPLVVKAYDTLRATDFDERMQLFYDGMAALGYAVALPIAVLAAPVVRLLYGDPFARSAEVLSVHVVSFLFVTLGVARSRFVLAENLTRFAMVTGVTAAGLNVALNLVLIPRHGALGAAWSTLLSYATANYLTGFLHARVRRHAWLMTRSLVVPFRPGGLIAFIRR